MNFKVCIECSLSEVSNCYKTELLKSLELRVKYGLGRKDIFFNKDLVAKDDCDIFVTDCFDLSNSSPERETAAALKSLFQLRWLPNPAIAIVFGFLREGVLKALSFRAFAIDIFQVPYRNPVLSHYICIRDGKLPNLLKQSLRVLFQSSDNTLKFKPKMIARDVWPSVAHRVAIPVAQALTGKGGHGMAHWDKKALEKALREITEWIKTPSSTPEYTDFLEFLFPLIDRLKQLYAIADTSDVERDTSPLMEALSILRNWPLDYPLDALYRIGQHDHPWLDFKWPKWVFVVEDDPYVVEGLKEFLESKKCELYVNEKAQCKDNELTYHDIRKWLECKWKKSPDVTDAENRSLMLLDLRIGSDKNSGLLGLEFLRKLKEEMSEITCLVISGYEQEVENALSLGADGYIIKPIEEDVLLKEIARLKYIGTVGYVLDKESRLAYLKRMESVCSTLTAPGETSEQKWKLVLKGLERLFDSKRIRFRTKKISENYSSLFEELADMVEVDSFLIDCEKGICTGNRPLFVDVVRALKMQDSNKALTILLPPGLWHKRPLWLYQYLRGVFQEEIDCFQQKPVFRFALSDSECTVDIVYNQITHERRIKYDVRYTILFPIEPVFGRFEEQTLNDPADKAATMFVIPAIKTFGFSASIDRLTNELTSHGVPEKGNPRYELFKTILTEMCARRKKWECFWRRWRECREIPEDNLEKEIEDVRNKLAKEELNPCEELGEKMVNTIAEKLIGLSKVLEKSSGLITFESWARKQVDNEMQNYWKRIWDYFGGDTRIELFLRGDWLNEAGQPVEDILVLVYVLTRYAPENQKWLEEKIIKGMKKKLGEEVVFLQEERVRVFAI